MLLAAPNQPSLPPPSPGVQNPGFPLPSKSCSGQWQEGGTAWEFLGYPLPQVGDARGDNFVQWFRFKKSS